MMSAGQQSRRGQEARRSQVGGARCDSIRYGNAFRKLIAQPLGRPG
jgi:hypothetical protein